MKGDLAGYGRKLESTWRDKFRWMLGADAGGKLRNYGHAPARKTQYALAGERPHWAGAPCRLMATSRLGRDRSKPSLAHMIYTP